MQYTHETESYNSRRYGKPWIATVSYPEDKPAFTFGTWNGSPGSEGVLTIAVNEGDIIAIGQKDHRKPSNSQKDFFVYREGSLEPVSAKNAYITWTNAQKSLEAVESSRGNGQDQENFSFTFAQLAEALKQIPTETLESELKRREGGAQ